ncbi:MAG: DUF805 domain-containing protein [Burkholderiaceae bacterium]|nr:DUF805 domain-containing protein [Burkholderiaceae bacterium]
MDYIQKYFINIFTSHYVDFEGRASRSEYWFFVLFANLAFLIIFIVDLLLFKIVGLPFVLTLLFILASILPGFAVSVRRLHDIGQSGWMLLINLIPFIGGIIFLVLTVLDSEAGSNKYGPNPKENDTNDD